MSITHDARTPTHFSVDALRQYSAPLGDRAFVSVPVNDSGLLEFEAYGPSCFGVEYRLAPAEDSNDVDFIGRVRWAANTIGAALPKVLDAATMPQHALWTQLREIVNRMRIVETPPVAAEVFTVERPFTIDQGIAPHSDLTAQDSEPMIVMMMHSVGNITNDAQWNSSTVNIENVEHEDGERIYRYWNGTVAPILSNKTMWWDPDIADYKGDRTMPALDDDTKFTGTGSERWHQHNWNDHNWTTTKKFCNGMSTLASVLVFNEATPIADELSEYQVHFQTITNDVSLGVRRFAHPYNDTAPARMRRTYDPVIMSFNGERVPVGTKKFLNDELPNYGQVGIAVPRRVPGGNEAPAGTNDPAAVRAQGEYNAVVRAQEKRQWARVRTRYYFN